MKTEEEKETEVTRKLKKLEEHMEDNAQKLDSKMAELQKILREELQKHSGREPRPGREVSSWGGGEGEFNGRAGPPQPQRPAPLAPLSSAQSSQLAAEAAAGAGRSDAAVEIVATHRAAAFARKRQT